MTVLFVVDEPTDWPLDLANVEVIAARQYLTDPDIAPSRGTKVFNLCQSYRYQSTGWYVSLLASARGHRPFPGVGNIVDMRSPALVRVVSEDLDALIQRQLKPLLSDRFTLSVYFGRNIARRYDPLARQIYNLFQAPLLRARFERRKGTWTMAGVSPIASRDVPDNHRGFVVEAAREYFAKGRFATPKRERFRYDLAILFDEDDADPPSDERAIRKFRKAAAELGIRTEIIDKDDYGRLSEFDALFIRRTTAVNHYTYRFARRAEAQGLVVMDDPASIVVCANKVYLAEMFLRHDVPHPKTLVVHADNIDEVEGEIGLPCVLKQPDSAYSLGVKKVDTPEELRTALATLLEGSDLVVAQEFFPTEYDWRVGILDREAVYVCKYHMAPKHWQIMHHKGGGDTDYGKVQTIALEDAPAHVVKTALKAANLVGDGLYGVDLKSSGKRCIVIEVNDNPSLESGFEDKVLGDELYARIMRSFLRRIEARHAAPAGSGDDGS